MVYNSALKLWLSIEITDNGFACRNPVFFGKVADGYSTMKKNSTIYYDYISEIVKIKR